MANLDDILAAAHRARLIPIVADSRKEEKITSVLLATLSVIPSLADKILSRCGERMAKTSQLDSYIEVNFPSNSRSGGDRPDGMISLSNRRKRWTALVEAKILQAEIDQEQIVRYGEIAREYGVDAVITISNQLVALPTHIPYNVPKVIKNRVNFFHLSWISIRTEALLILRNDDELDRNEKFILAEMIRYFENDGSGIKGFDQMNPDWRSLISGVRDGKSYKRNSPEIENTVASWHQEERDIALILSRNTGERVNIQLPLRHRREPELRVRHASEHLVSLYELKSTFTVPNAASGIEVAANLKTRTISCSMKIAAPGDRQRPSARARWLARQLRGIDGSDIIVRARWRGRTAATQVFLSEIQEDPRCLENGKPSSVLIGFEVVMIRDLAAKFGSRKAFIEELEDMVPDFYDRVGQNLRNWMPPPPTISRERTTPDESAGEYDGSVESPHEDVEEEHEKERE